MSGKAILLATAVCLSGVLATPANAAARSPEGICGAGFGRVSGGTKAVTTPGGRRLGTVYLLYSRKTQQNCVVTIKSVLVGEASPVSAELTVMPKAIKDTKQDPTVRRDSGKFKYYAGPVKYWAKQACVKFWGRITLSGRDPIVAQGGRKAWGNCGG